MIISKTDSIRSTHIGAVKKRIMLNILKLTLVITKVMTVISRVVIMNTVNSVKSIYYCFFCCSSLPLNGLN